VRHISQAVRSSSRRPVILSHAHSITTQSKVAAITSAK
jgi:hypothetical protein